MFGYIGINPELLSKEMLQRYQSYYCGLCDVLKKRHGNLGRITLSYDMTFLLILLSSLYEPDENLTQRTCLAHPINKCMHTSNALSQYIADMNIALAYFKFKDDWVDDHNALAYGQMKMLQHAYNQTNEIYPEKCACIASCLRTISEIENANSLQIDAPANLTGALLGEIFVYQHDQWQEPLRQIGEMLGRFIYVMDAFEDMEEDEKKHRYNPLLAMKHHDDFLDICQDYLMLTMANCAQAFETLPLIQDIEILQNILYGGVWRKYVAICEKRKKEAA